MLFVVLPAYNEGPALEKLLPEMTKALHNIEYTIIVVDDGSQDNTAQVAERFKAAAVTLVQHPKNLGLGEAIRTGLSSALELATEDDVIVTMDSDNTHSPSLIKPMSQRIEQGFDLVVASRFVEGGKEIGLSFFRRLLSRGAGFVMGRLFPIEGIRDYSCGFRAYRAGLLRKVFTYYDRELIEAGGFAIMVEILLKMTIFSPRCCEVPLVLRYDLKQGKSKMPILKTLLGYLGLIVRLKRAVHVRTGVEV